MYNEREILKVGDDILVKTIHGGLFKTKVERMTRTQAIMKLRGGRISKRLIRVPINGGHELGNSNNRINRHMYWFHKWTQELEDKFISQKCIFIRPEVL
jgi:hypothetical protein